MTRSALNQSSVILDFQTCRSKHSRFINEEDASVNMAIGCAHNVMVNAEADDDIKGRIYEELLTIAKEHQDGDYVGYDRSIHVVSAIA